MGDYRSKNKILWEVVKLNFCLIFFIGASATKGWEKSSIFRHGLPFDFFGEGQKPHQGRIELMENLT